jgi:hypothetical protein
MSNVLAFGHLKTREFKMMMMMMMGDDGGDNDGGGGDFYQYLKTNATAEIDFSYYEGCDHSRRQSLP